jgi:hypothetical protein
MRSIPVAIGIAIVGGLSLSWQMPQAYAGSQQLDPASSPPTEFMKIEMGLQPLRGELLLELRRIRHSLQRIEALLQQDSVERSVPRGAERCVEELPKSSEIDGLRLCYETPVDRFESGQTVPLGNGYHTFVDVPALVAGRHYTVRNGYQGKAVFDVVKSQTVFMAIYPKDWGGGGNPSGDWLPEVLTKEQLIEQGWEEIGSLRVMHSNPDYPEEPAWLLLARDCRAGESFRIRTHKYQAPVLIWGSHSAPAESSK